MSKNMSVDSTSITKIEVKIVFDIKIIINQ